MCEGGYVEVGEKETVGTAEKEGEEELVMLGINVGLVVGMDGDVVGVEEDGVLVGVLEDGNVEGTVEGVEVVGRGVG